MNKCEQALRELKSEISFYRQEIKRMESEEPLTAEEDYVCGHSETMYNCSKKIDALNIALSALQEKLEREKGCAECNNTVYARTTDPKNDNYKGRPRYKCMIVAHKNYCQNCGKKLGECDG